MFKFWIRWIRTGGYLDNRKCYAFFFVCFFMTGPVFFAKLESQTISLQLSHIISTSVTAGDLAHLRTRICNRKSETQPQLKKRNYN